MGKFVDITGHKYGRLTVISRAPGYGRALFNVKCDCGTEKIVDGYHMRKGNIVSCGCYLTEILHSPEKAEQLRSIAGSSTRTHRMSQEPIYFVWKAMRQRCQNPKSADYKWYGAKGVKVCAEWESFENFFADMGYPPAGLTLDRIDPTGDYCKANCRWATWAEQQNNKRQSYV